MDDLKRREFLKLWRRGCCRRRDAACRTSRPVDRAERPFSAAPIEMVRIGYVGIGGQGSGHVRNLLGIPGCPDHRRLRRPAGADRLGDEGDHRGRPSGARRSAPAGPRDFERLCETEAARSRLQRHAVGVPRARSCCAAMKNGKHTADRKCRRP